MVRQRIRGDYIYTYANRSRRDCFSRKPDKLLGKKFIKWASFRGKHNEAKSLTLIALTRGVIAAKQEGWLSCQQLSHLTGVSNRSLLSLVKKWVSWGLMIRDTWYVGNRPTYVYKIGDAGQAWLNRHWNHMPLERYALKFHELQQELGGSKD
jgi:hypothetical protein